MGGMFYGYNWEAGKAKQVLYPTADNHIHELSLTLGSGWQHADLSTIPGVPSTTSSLHGYGWQGAREKQVVFMPADNHIHELSFGQGGQWQHVDLTAITGAPTSSAFIANGYSWESGNSKQVVFLTADGHIHELYMTWGRRRRWQHADLTAIAKAPPAASYPVAGYSWEVAKAKQVAFLTADGHIHELYATLGSGWKHADLTAIANAPPASYPIIGYGWEAGKAKQVVFRTADGHIHESYVTLGGGWQHADLTAMARAPLASSLSAGYSWESGNSKQVVFLTADGHIHELYVTLGSRWQHADLTAIAGAPPTNHEPHGYGWETGKGKQVVFATADGHIHELSVTLGTGWKHADLTSLASAPPSSLAVPPGPPAGPPSTVPGGGYETEVVIIDRTGTAVLPAQGRIWELVPPKGQRELETREAQGKSLAFNQGRSIPGKSIGISIHEAMNPTFTGSLFRSGPLSALPSGAAGLIEIGIPADIVDNGTMLTAGLPAVPFTAPGTSPPITVSSLTPVLGTDTVTLTVGLGYFVAMLNLQFTYTLTFGIAPSPHMNDPNQICTLLPSGPGALSVPGGGFLLGTVVGQVLKEPEVRATVVTAVEGALNKTILSKVATSLGQPALPAGVTISMRRVAITPTGITFSAALGAYGGLVSKISFS